MAAEVIRLPDLDRDLMERALACAEASRMVTDPFEAEALRELALELWADAHRARRDAMYVRGKRNLIESNAF